MLKALSNLLGMRLIDEVKLAILRRTTRTRKLVLDPAIVELRHAVFDHRLLIRRQLMRHTDARYLDAWIDLREKLSFERIFPAQFTLLTSHFSRRGDLQLKNQSLIEIRVLCPVCSHILLTC